MNEETSAKQPSSPQQQTSGIFPQKPPMQPLNIKSGKRKSIELLCGAVVVILAFIFISILKNSYLKPVHTYYKGLSKSDTSAMCEAFPSWLRNANTDDETITVEGMCNTIMTSVLAKCGADCKVSAEMVSYSEKDDAYLNTLEEGIETQYGKTVNITKGRWVKLNVTYQYGGGKQEMTEYARIYKINGRWVLLDIPGAEA